MPTFPKYTNQPYRIALVDIHLDPDPTGYIRRWFSDILAKCGISYDACFVGESYDSEFTSAIREFSPNVTVLFSPNALTRALGDKVSLENYRGSLFSTAAFTSIADELKCLAALPPRDIYTKRASDIPLLLFDLKRARDEGTSPVLSLPERHLDVDLTPEGILLKLDELALTKPKIAIDIEGYVFRMTCISIATSPSYAFIIPFTNSFWPEHLEPLMWRSLANVLGDPDIPKILQNSLYDTFVLQHSYNLPVRGIIDDTMLKHWALYCELPKSLGFQASIYTKEPYYKSERSSDDRRTHYAYCCKDSAVTYEISDKLDTLLHGPALAHYRLNVSLLEPLLYMELKGMAYDSIKASDRLAYVNTYINRLQWMLNELTGMPFNPANTLHIMRETFCFVKASSRINTFEDVLPNCKLPYLSAATEALNIIKRSPLTLSDLGHLSYLLEQHLNVDSPPQIAHLLYRVLQLPPQYKKEKGRLTDKETTDALALLTLYKKTDNLLLKLILLLRGARTRTDALKAKTDPDNRIRCGYNIVGSETGRVACYESPTGSGFNLQTATKKDRDLFIADEGFWFFQCDLAGADGWTVAANCKALGDPTMLDDYLFGLKPAKIIALMYAHGASINQLTRDALKTACRDVDGEGWLYFACKRVQHGSNYLMKEKTISDTILKDSYKFLGEPIRVEPSICAILQRLYFSRYSGVLRWQTRVKTTIQSVGSITSASGHRRVFFGRKSDHTTFAAACSHEPQHNTTYATNLAMHRLWFDPENRNGTELIVQPLHQVHDALIGQFPKDRTPWACTKLNEYFRNPITIAGQLITIPFEGAYGPSWKELNVGTI
jgi:DNA polymerase I-like protein with 3'-5' exonuclease and polymerase domains